MDSWSSLEIGGGAEANKFTGEIQEAFLPVFEAAGKPKGMAVYSRCEIMSGTVTLYFTPSADMFSGVFGAAPCEQPPTEGLVFLAGDADALATGSPH